jgi:hypothetical protein
MLDDNKKTHKRVWKTISDSQAFRMQHVLWLLNTLVCIISQYGKFILFNIPKKEIIRGFYGS